MVTREDLADFWSAHFRTEGQRKTLSGHEDSQVRAIRMVCHTLFLLVSDIKTERDEAIEFASKQKEIRVCQSCKKQVFKDNLDDAVIDEEKTTSSESLDESQETVMLDIKKEVESQDSPRKQESSLSSGETVPSKPVPKAQKKRDPNYRCLSKSSPRRLKKKLKVETDVGDDILVPETLSLDEHELHVNVEVRKALATRTVFVPETAVYGNTDFFESQTIFSQDIDHIRSSNESSECKSPEKSLFNESELKTQLSPVLGKQGNTTPKASRKPLNISKPTPPNFDSPPKEPLQQVDANIPKEVKTSQICSTLQINTEDLKSENLVCQAASTPRYSPLKFTHSLSPPLSDVSFTSPSLLPSMKDKGNNMVLTLPSPSFKTPDKVKPAGSTRSIKRLLSAVPDGKAKENSRTLRRHQTDSTTNKGRLYEINVEPPDPNKKKKYKQARIFEMSLVPKTDVVKLSGGVPKMSFDDELKAACEASLKTKEREDLLRQEREFQSDASPEKAKNDVKEKKPKLKSPKKLSLKLKESGHSSPVKGLKKSPKKSPLKRLRQSPSKLSPLKKGREGEQEASKGKEMVGLDDLLDQVNESPVHDHMNSKVKAPSPKKKLMKAFSEHITSKEAATSDPNKNAKRSRAYSTDESPKSAKRKKPSRVFLDSFDVPPNQDIEPGYAYQGPVVRKKVERRQLEGWSCRECKNFYEDEDLDPVKKKMLMNKCSRHRSKHNPVTNTPEGFWNPEWVDKTQS